MSLSPRDMDFIALKNMAAREIALALGVPSMLLGIPGDSTHANYAEANRVFWRQTVIPLVQRSVSAMSEWLTPGFGRNLELRPDIDSLDALADDEKRATVGYGPKPQDLAAKLFNPDQPRDEIGRWTDGGGVGMGGKIPNDVVNPGRSGEKPTREAAKGKFQKAPSIPPPPPPKKGETEPKYKEPIPGQSGKEAKDKVPDWVRQQKERPGTSEDGNGFTKRIMDWKYPERNGVHPKGAGSEWSEIQKWADSHFK
jgi:Phage portal protein